MKAMGSGRTTGMVGFLNRSRRSLERRAPVLLKAAFIVRTPFRSARGKPPRGSARQSEWIEHSPAAKSSSQLVGGGCVLGGLNDTERARCATVTRLRANLRFAATSGRRRRPPGAPLVEDGDAVAHGLQPRPCRGWSRKTVTPPTLSSAQHPVHLGARRRVQPAWSARPGTAARDSWMSVASKRCSLAACLSSSSSRASFGRRPSPMRSSSRQRRRPSPLPRILRVEPAGYLRCSCARRER